MDRLELLTFLRKHRLCVQATVAVEGGPQAAVVGYAVSEQLELIFDTLASTRKAQNLRRDARIAIVVGWDGEQTLQLEGLADEPSGEDLERLKRLYLAAFPEGVERQSWPGISYVRVRPHWARFSDFGAGGSIVELDQNALMATAAATRS
jgi:general stress protein 26